MDPKDTVLGLLIVALALCVIVLGLQIMRIRVTLFHARKRDQAMCRSASARVLFALQLDASGRTSHRNVVLHQLLMDWGNGIGWSEDVLDRLTPHLALALTEDKQFRHIRDMDWRNQIEQLSGRCENRRRNTKNLSLN